MHSKFIGWYTVDNNLGCACILFVTAALELVKAELSQEQQMREKVVSSL